MIKIIIRKWIKNFKNIKDKKVRESYIILSGILGVLCNLLLFITKFSIGSFINSISVISDAFNNINDLGSSLVVIVGAKLSNRPPDTNHPYGYGRFEYIASLIVAFIIFSVGFQLLRSSYDRLINPQEITFSFVTLIILVLAVLVKLWMFSYNLYIAKQIESTLNRAAAYDSINDCIATSMVIMTMIIDPFVNIPIDGAAGIIISLLILYSGFSIAKDTISLLLGSSPDPETVENINRLVCSGKHVLGTHDLKVFDYGPGRVLASIHAEVPDNLNIAEGHSCINILENQIAKELGIEIIIHTDPISTDIDKIEMVRKDVISCIHKVNKNIRIQNFRIKQADKLVTVFFDLKLSEIPESNHNNIKKVIEEKIEETYKNYEVIIKDIVINNHL
ncbi:MAG: cation diffusion facilitator family transporter [Desulfitobacteriaceae bacterium]|nr:cation diffusion facilitator family transporter [Clostridia bacterium]MDD4346335.1 cation diffusion facilitator family transporter [Desulfitobacteriaceae bacterium]MDD4400573.1 cation diffusion facilitator family transporter [Desulfitobacteriaceae bacterium]